MLATLAFLAGPAEAANKPATCATLQTVLDGASDGDVITLDSSDGTGGLCNGTYNLKDFSTGASSYATWTLQGNPNDGNADGFDRNEVTTRALTGVNVNRLEITDLSFRDGRQTGSGGAISITGESSTGIRNSRFFNNRATLKGGAVFISESAASGGGGVAGWGLSNNTFGVLGDASQNNQADTGGAVAVEAHSSNGGGGLNGSSFYGNVAAKTGGAFDYLVEAGQGENTSTSGNVFDGNKAGGGGGGAHLQGNAGGNISVDGGNTFQNNIVDPSIAGAPTGAHYGGGLWLELDHAGGFYRGNKFLNNQILAATPATDYGGGGEAVTGQDTAGAPAFRGVQNNTYVGNTLPAAGAGNDSEGGGLFVEGPSLKWHSWLTVIAGNSIGAGGEGGGAYAGAAAEGTRLEFADSTIAGNTVGAGGQYPGLAGNGDDRLSLHNTIVWNEPTPGNPDIGGFSTLSGDLDIQYSDACNGSMNPLVSGFGNICANPLLKDAAGGDIHETLTSPTVDAGNDDLFMGEEEFPCCDFEGDPRPTDGDGDGHTVDMGADEGPAFVHQQPPPPTPEQCRNGKDDDNDGAIDLADPGCANAADNNEGDESLNALVLCGSRVISLVRADAVGKKAVLTGVVASKYAGKKVGIYANYPKKGGLKQVASAKASSDGNFKARLPLPSKKRFNKARFQARIAGKKSATLKLPQSLASSSVKKSGSQVVLKGTVKKALLGKRNPVTVRRLTCGHYTKVGQAKPGKNGKYVVRFAVPAGSSAALYRAETTVLNKPRGKKYVKQYARAIGITLAK